MRSTTMSDRYAAGARARRLAGKGTARDSREWAAKGPSGSAYSGDAESYEPSTDNLLVLHNAAHTATVRLRRHSA